MGYPHSYFACVLFWGPKIEALMTRIGPGFL